MIKIPLGSTAEKTSWTLFSYPTYFCVLETTCCCRTIPLKNKTFAGPGCNKQQRRHLEVPGCRRGAAGGDQPQAGKVITGDDGDNGADGYDYDDADDDYDEEK